MAAATPDQPVSEQPQQQFPACVAALAAWREEQLPHLSPRAAAFLKENSTLRRFAAATNGDAAKSITRLRETIAWREESLAPPLSCPDCGADPLSHCFHCLGLSGPTPADPGGCALVYACAARARTNETVGAVRHMLHTLEHAWASPAGVAAGAERLLWVVDFNGFGMSHALQGAFWGGARGTAATLVVAPPPSPLARDTPSHIPRCPPFPVQGRRATPSSASFRRTCPSASPPRCS